MGRFFPVLGDVPNKNRSYTIIAPLSRRKSLEMKIVTTVASTTNNGDENETKQHNTTNAQNSTTTLEKYVSLKYKKDQSRGSFCYKSSWRSLKDLLMPGSPCDQYRCPTIKQRFESHQKDSHNKKCDCVKHRNSDNNTPVRRKCSRVSIRSGPDYDQYSDQSLPKESNPNKLTKCRETCQLKSSLVKRNYNLEPKMDGNNQDKSQSDINNSQENNDTSTKGNVIALKYKDTPMASQTSEPVEKENYRNQEEKETYTKIPKTEDTNNTIASSANTQSQNSRYVNATQFKNNQSNTQSQNSKYVNATQFNDNQSNTENSVIKNEETFSDNNYSEAENYKAISAKYTNTEDLEETQNTNNKFQRSVERGTSPESDEKNANDRSYVNNRLERKCSKDCQYYTSTKISRSLKDTFQQLASKVDKSICNAKEDVKFTRESLIFERPLCADIFTSTYRDSFNNPHDLHVPQPERPAQMDHENTNNFNDDIFEDIICKENKMCACKIHEFDAPSNGSHNKCAISEENNNGKDKKQTLKDLYTTTYRDAFKQYYDSEKCSTGHENGGYTNDGNHQMHIIDEPNLPSSSRNLDHCSCSTSFDFNATTNNNNPRIMMNDSVPYKRPELLKESISTCCYNPYSDKSLVHDEKINIQKRDAGSQYESNTNQFDRIYNTRSSNSYLTPGNCKNVCCTTSNNNLIEKEVEEWIYEVPMYAAIEKGAQKYFNAIVKDLIKNLSRISKQVPKSKYEENVRNEINTYLNKIPIWYPGARRDQEEFKRSIIDRLVQRLNKLTTKDDVATCSYFVSTEVSTSLTLCKPISSNSILTRDDEIRICITEWLRLVYSKSIHVMHTKIPELVELVFKQIEPLLKIPVNTYNRKVILKSAIVNTLNDLPITICFPRSDVQTYNLAKNLADSLLYIQDKYGRDGNIPRVIKYNNSNSINVPRVINNNILRPIEKVDNIITNEIRKCFEQANIDFSNNMLIEETGVILLDCFDVPDPESKYAAKREITNLLINTADISEVAAKNITNTLMRKARKILSEGNTRRRSNIFHQRKKCTVLLCTSVKEPGPISCYSTYLRNRKSRRGIIKLYSKDFIDKSIQ